MNFNEVRNLESQVVYLQIHLFPDDISIPKSQKARRDYN